MLCICKKICLLDLFDFEVQNAYISRRNVEKNEPECGVIIFEGAGHCVNMDTPNQFNAVMEEFWFSGNPPIKF